MNRTEIFPKSGQTGTHGGNFLRLNARGAAISAPAGVGHASDFELSTYPQNSQRKKKEAKKEKRLLFLYLKNLKHWSRQ